MSHSDEEWLPSDDLGVTHGTGASGQGNTMSGAVRSAPSDARSDSAAARASSLKAARNSLLRDDVAAARAQLNEISAAHRDDQQVVALQKQIEARADQEQREDVSSHEEKAPEPMPKAVRAGPPTAAKGGHARDTQLASREHSNRVTAYTGSRRNAGEGVGKPVSAEGAAAARTATGAATGTATGTANDSTYASQHMKVVREPAAPAALNSPPLLQHTAPAAEQQTIPPQTQAPTQTVAAPQSVQSEQAVTQPEITAQATLPAPVVATTVPSAPLLNADGPKTRAQVRAEIARARENGSLPAFGNPDPAGPGGAPSLTIAPRP